MHHPRTYMLPPLHELRQTAAELLALAVCDLFPKTHMIKSATSDIGFSYDFVLTQHIDDQALPLIEERMRALVKKQMPIRMLDMMRDNAVDFLRHHKQNMRAEILEEMNDNIVQIFQMGNFVDCCPGPYLANTEEVGAIKLQAFTLMEDSFDELGDVTVTRIFGTAFPDNYSLKQFLKRAEQAKKRDHRVLGPALNLFSLLGDEQTGSWMWHPRGAALRETLLDCVRKTPQNQHVIKISTPPITPSGTLLQILEDAGLRNLEEEILDPSLFHALHYQTQSYSPIQLPVRYQEFALRCENNLDSDLCGLFLTETYTTDLTHIFCTKEQIETQLISCLQFIDKFIKIFGFEYRWYLQVKGTGSKDNKSFWKKSIDFLAQALTACKIEYTLDTQTPMRYGPRAEVRIIDSLKREWKGPFTAIDITHPERLGLRYLGEDGHSGIPVMIVQSLFGSIERFIALLIEHYSGALPFWLAPEQVRVIPLSKNNGEYASKVCAQIVQAGFRCEIDSHPGSLGEKVYLAEKEQIPYIAIVGDSEEKRNVIALRSDNNSKRKASPTVDQFLQLLQQEGGSSTLLERVQNESPNNR